MGWTKNEWTRANEWVVKRASLLRVWVQEASDPTRRWFPSRRVHVALADFFVPTLTEMTTLKETLLPKSLGCQVEASYSLKVQMLSESKKGFKWFIFSRLLRRRRRQLSVSNCKDSTEALFFFLIPDNRDLLARKRLQLRFLSRGCS